MATTVTVLSSGRAIVLARSVIKDPPGSSFSSQKQGPSTVQGEQYARFPVTA